MRFYGRLLGGFDPLRAESFCNLARQIEIPLMVHGSEQNRGSFTRVNSMTHVPGQVMEGNLLKG